VRGSAGSGGASMSQFSGTYAMPSDAQPPIYKTIVFLQVKLSRATHAASMLLPSVCMAAHRDAKQLFIRAETLGIGGY
jgi:hypothetical protein